MPGIVDIEMLQRGSPVSVGPTLQSRVEGEPLKRQSCKRLRPDRSLVAYHKRTYFVANQRLDEQARLLQGPRGKSSMLS